MLKKILISFVLVIVVLSGLYWLKTSNNVRPQSQPTQQPVTAFEDKVYEYNAESLSDNCNLNSKMACAVDFAIKCTLNPNYSGCHEAKLPRFIFMEDENLQRPTKISFKISKIKPISSDLVELHTDSTCNGNWFGLCQGRVIYVLVPLNDGWRVKDIYAIES